MSEVVEYKCPNCGGSIQFDSKAQKMKCPYCDTEFDVEALKEYKKQQENMPENDMHWDASAGAEWTQEDQEALGVYTCSSCGGEIIADENTAATACPFCGSPIVLQSRVSGDLKPDLIIPFQKDRQDAKNTFENFLKKRWLLPKVFKKENHIDEIQGIYVPFWLYDACCDASMQMKATRVRTWSDADFIYTATSFYGVYRSGDLSFADVPEDGSSKMPDDLMESLEPFDISEAKSFETGYLAGYLADRYDVSAQECQQRAANRIRQSTENALRNTVVGYDTVITENSSASLHDSSVRYALYPVWILNTTWRDRHFVFAMNGQTGRIVGDLPVDWGIFWRWFFLFTGIFGCIVYLIVWLLH